ncbi:Uncharacterised protein [Streptococcus constellatus]|uniref:Uncharacterized protein n=1 Tax=Streptococcus constellatus TaxID=76860 RepID=A0A564SG30_STRCV|nr:hypothetical protein [Streptococcus constellatus]VUW94094.1 Uncharacterised protein [Streptococcus constellatus]VUX09991.1 Uncharacterised protein [Streptococcus gordonii]
MSFFVELYFTIYHKKKRELLSSNYDIVKIPLGMALDNVIQRPEYRQLVIGGLYLLDISVPKEDLLTIKDQVDSFCIMYAAANNRLDNIKAYNLLKSKTVYFLGEMLRADINLGQQFGYQTLKREVSGHTYEAIPCFLTEESAQKFNSQHLPVSPVNLEYLKFFWNKPLIIEPYRNYWIEFL